MASIPSIKKGFTLLEITITILLFSFIILILSSIYLTTIRSILIANDYYDSFSSINLGTEKIWKALKNGWYPKNLQLTPNSIIFKDQNCNDIKIQKNNEILEYCKNNNCFSLFDENLVKVKEFTIKKDTTASSTDYFTYAPKVFVIYYNLNVKSKRGDITNIEFQQAVAPFYSVFSFNRCGG